jgi:prepilin-type N-terminal cleavage/methylation domain-containing protein
MITPQYDKFRSFAPAFTLIELMLAVAILGLIMVMLAGSFHAVAMGKTHAEARLAAGQQNRTIAWSLSNEIRGAVQTSGFASHVLIFGVARLQNNSPLDSLMISTLDPGHRRAIEGFGSEDLISYTTAPNRDHRGWFLLYRTQSSSLLTGTDGGNGTNGTVLLADNLLALHFRYYDGNVWFESWNSNSLPPGRQLPQAISLDVVLAESDSASLRLSTMITLPMAFAQW